MLCGLAQAGEADGQGVSVVRLEGPAQPLDASAPPSRFNIPDGETLWSAAWNRASKPSAGQGPGAVSMAEFVGEGFRSAKGFKCEKFQEGDSGGELLFTLTADEAVKKGGEVRLTNMRLAFFNKGARPTQPGPEDKPDKQKKARGPAARAKAGKAGKEIPAAQQPRAKKGAQAGAAAEQPGGIAGGVQVLVTAPRAILDVATNGGRASGQVTVEVFPLSAGGTGQTAAGRTAIAVMKTERLAWRTWSEPRDGSTELAVYTGSTKPDEPDPVVFGHYIMAQPDGTDATLDIEGQGLVFEEGSYERPMPKEDEDGRTVGVSKIVHEQAIFRHKIKLVTTASGMQALLPGATGLPAPNAAPKEVNKPAPAATPSETVVLCEGPAVLNLAAMPRAGTISKPMPEEEAPDPAKDAGGGAGELAQPGGELAQPAVARAKVGERRSGSPVLVPSARRFEFYNGVSVKQTPLQPPENAGAARGVHSDMSSRHLCLQYPAGVVPGPATFPEYAEALGAVRMSGARTVEPAPGDPNPPRLVPYGVVCERVYYDGPKDSTWLVGSKSVPAVVKDEKGEAFAEEFCYVRSTETLTMPAHGFKKMLIKSVAPPPAAAAGTGVPAVSTGTNAPGAINFGSGDTIIEWRGPLTREVRHLPVPQQPDRIKEVLVLKEDVRIEQPGGGLKMRGQTIRIVRSVPAGNVEFLEGLGGVEAMMGDLHAVGETISVEMGYGQDGALTRDAITVTGSREKDAQATLFTGSSAVRSDKFIIDRLADTFRSFGGAVAVVKSPPPPPTPSRGGEGAGGGPAAPKPQAAQDAGAMFKGISFQGGGDLFIQCDGEFSKDAAHRMTIKDRVLVRQVESGGAYSELLADEVYLTLADAAPDTGTSTAPGAPAGAFFSGDFKSLAGLGHVEIRSPDQLVECDRLDYDKEKDVSVLRVDDPENDVRVYMKEPSGGTRILSARKSLEVDGSSGKFTPGGELVILPYRAKVPAARDKESSPARKRKP